jgi:hypothetical protein
MCDAIIDQLIENVRKNALVGGWAERLGCRESIKEVIATCRHTGSPLRKTGGSVSTPITPASDYDKA